MKLIRTLADLPSELRRGAVAVGNFDGVHRGHADIVERLCAAARRIGGGAVVFTFDPHPARLLRPDLAPPPLTWAERKAELLAERGADAVIAYPTDAALLALTPAEFFTGIIRERLDARALVEGQNFYFGQDRAGNVQVLRQLCLQHGIELEVVAPRVINGSPISSSRIRLALQRGDVEQAGLMLGRPYRLRGLVARGAGRGRALGFPTANLESIDTLVPGPGVYAGRARTAGPSWAAAIHIGPNPTFGEESLKLEVHLIGFAGSLYGQTLEVDFQARLRDIQAFGSAEELRDQLQRDIARAGNEDGTGPVRE